MKVIRYWIALLRWWWEMPVRADYQMAMRSEAFHRDTEKWLEKRPLIKSNQGDANGRRHRDPPCRR